MIGGVGSNPYESYQAMQAASPGQLASALKTAHGAKAKQIEKAMSSAQLTAMKRTGAVECETCKNRKYQDGSNEGDVSFKAPGHIAPNMSAATVMSHEQEHVANAYEKAAKGNGKVMQASVKLHTAVCPECGRSFVSGGLTTTVIKYNEESPYGKAFKSMDKAGVLGFNVDESV
ncbi:MAG: hypothetical protein K6C69_01665 [Lachnospiraceae bacterium]|nr:hypothetical protein [Lachnospiraceae bacterium]